MLEIKGLTKIYRSKKAGEVRALDNVSISFPETGMVFILGKSGSGKSTLLNIIGGLDSYDMGEFIIKGKSSEQFGGSDFDAYRNTFIGFIFQEYNVLDEFTVGANVALALELQGKKATPTAIGNILEQVDLTGYAKRKPNELSGGQKQRVAIARALVKDPQIIMADEPTGALDSNTGKQIFDTLKNLSRTKLVLVVSHDRDFAEKYADRIIELSDGRIISDVTRRDQETEKVSEGIEKLGKSLLRIKAGYTLTAEDLQMINAYLAENKTDVILSGDSRVNDELRSVTGITEKGGPSVFEDTKADRDYRLKQYEKRDSKFIRSRLPAKNAVRIGASGLKHKRFRLVMTVFLSLIAFSLFGFADTLAAYQKYNATVDSLYDSNIRNASVTLGVRNSYIYGNGETYISYSSEGLNDDDIKFLNSQTGLNFVPVYTGSGFGGGSGGYNVTESMKSFNGDGFVYGGRIQGLVSMTEEMLSTAGLRADAGRLPNSEGEIAITELLFRQFNKFGFKDARTEKEIKAGELTMTADDSENTIIGKYIRLGTSYSGDTHILKVVGVVDTKFDYERYASFIPDENDIGVEEENMLTQMVLQMELESEIVYGFHALGFAHEKDIETISANSHFHRKEIGTYMQMGSKRMYLTVNSTPLDSEKGDSVNSRTMQRVAGSDSLKNLKVTWVDGVARTVLGENEILLPMGILNSMIPYSFTLEISVNELNEFMTAKYGQAWTNRSEYSNVYERIMYAAQEYYGNEPFNYEYEQCIETMQKDVYPFFIEKLGITLPDENMTFTRELYYELTNIIQSMTFDGEFIQVKIEEHQLSQTICALQAEYAVPKYDLVNDNSFLDALIRYFYGGDIGERTEEEIARDSLYFYANQYLDYWELGYEKNQYGLSGVEIDALVKNIIAEKAGITPDTLTSRISFNLSTMEWRDDTEVNTGFNSKSYTVVGFFDTEDSSVVVCDTLLQEFEGWRLNNMDEYDCIEDVAPHEAGIWTYALAPLPKDRAVIEKLVSLSYAEDGVDLRFELRNYVMDTLDSFNEFIEIGAQVFLYVGIGFAVFSALLLMNFISTSISYKKREIGVLRAVGARSSDVFKIFFSESLIIALINFACSTAVVIGGIFFANNMMREEGITITLLSYGYRQFLLMLAISVGVALIASFLPVNRIAKKKPVDAIKDR